MKSLLRLEPFLRRYWKSALISLLTLLVLTAADLTLPAIIKGIIDNGLGKQDVKFLVISALVILGLGLLRAGLSYVQRYVSEWTAAHIGYDMRNMLYDHIQQLPFSYHDHAQTGQIISRCIEDVRAIERFAGFSIVELIRLGILMVGVFILLFNTQPRLAAISLLPMIPLAWITISFGRRVGGFFFNVDTALGELSSRVQENVSGVHVVRAFAREPYEIQRFSQANQVLFKARVKTLNEFSKIMPTTHFLVTTGTILILWFGGQMALAGTMSVGEVVAFNAYVLLLSMPAQQLAWLVNSAGEAIAGVQRAYEILDIEPEIRSPANAVSLNSLQGKVEFRNVSFKYQDQVIQAVENIDLVVEPNQVIALIGPTGSGKSSLVSLIPRFYDVDEGGVFVDGRDVREVELASLRKQIGIVLQSSLLFSATIAANIAYGRVDATQAEIESAAEAAQAHEFILGLPEGYQTVVGEKGVTLSGGQRQRVAIARALLLNPRILILDDSTSSVDLETEGLIQKALKISMEGRTTFVIAHRLSTVRRADLIVVLDHGRIVERGTHLGLLQQNGLYREIYELQLKSQEEHPTRYEQLGVAQDVTAV